MPWDQPETWDAELLEAYRTLIGLRRSSRALARGGIRFAHVGDGRDRLPPRDAGRAGALPRGRARRPATSACPLAALGSTAAASRSSGRRRGSTRERRRPARRRACVPRLETAMRAEETPHGRREAAGDRQGLSQRVPRREGPLARDRGRRVPRPRRAVRLRQDDRAPDGRRARDDHRRRGLDRRARRQPDDAEGPGHRDGVPELRALPPSLRGRQHRVRAPPAQDAEARRRGAHRLGGAACST